MGLPPTAGTGVRPRLGVTLIAIGAFALAQGASASQRHLLVIAGIGGEEHYTRIFDGWATQLVEIAERALAVPPARVTLLSGSQDGTRAAPRKADVIQALQAAALASEPGDLVMVVLMGHGTARNGRALFNLPGPDLSATELKQHLDAFAGRSLVIVNTTSSSGAFVRELSAGDRVVITATASGSEYQFAHFGGHFVGAFVADGADADKDGRVSILEAFNYARASVARAFEEDDRILTEHALLDDDGDGVGSRLTEPTQGDGALAARLFLQPSAGELAGDSEQARAMLALDVRASELVNRIDRLKRQRERLLDEEFYAELESLLVTLAYNRRELREVMTEHELATSQ